MNCKFTDYKRVPEEDILSSLNSGYEIITSIICPFDGESVTTFIVARRDCASCPTLCRFVQQGNLVMVETGLVTKL